jgi:hypothetical protein
MQIEFSPADHWWIALQERVIELTGRAIEDLSPQRLNSLRIRRLTEIERRTLDEYERCFPRPMITQGDLRAALTGPDRLWKEEDIRLALADGTHVEPGPIIAFLRWCKPDANYKRHTFSVQIRERRERARKIGGQQ